MTKEKRSRERATHQELLCLNSCLKQVLVQCLNSCLKQVLIRVNSCLEQVLIQSVSTAV